MVHEQLKQVKPTMNLDEQRLREITEHKTFYHHKLDEAETELEKDLLQVQIDKLNEEQSEILKRCKAI